MGSDGFRLVSSLLRAPYSVLQQSEVGGSRVPTIHEKNRCNLMMLLCFDSRSNCLWYDSEDAKYEDSPDPVALALLITRRA